MGHLDLVKESNIPRLTAGECRLAGSSSSAPRERSTTLLALGTTSALSRLSSDGSSSNGGGSRSDRDGLGSRGDESGGGYGDGSGCGRSNGGGGTSGSRSGGGSGGSSAETGDGGSGASDGGAGLRDVDGALDESRARDGVGGHGAVDVEEDAGVVGGVELGALDAGGLVGAGAGDLDVEALGVVLGAVGVVGAVEGDDLVAQDVEAGSNVGRDLDEPAVAVLDELVGAPLAGGGGAVDEADLVDLEELESGLVDGLAAGGAAVGEVVDHGTVVGLGPGVPLDGDLVTSRDNSMAFGVGRVTVADDISRGESIRSNEAVVRVFGGPANDDRRVGLVRKAEDIITLVRVTVDDNVGNMTVGRNRGRTGEDGKKRLGSERRHLG